MWRVPHFSSLSFLQRGEERSKVTLPPSFVRWFFHLAASLGLFGISSLRLLVGVKRKVVYFIYINRSDSSS